MKGKIEVICGPMFSGKTEELIRRIKRAQIAKLEVASFKPKIDDRYSHDCIASHDGSKQKSILIDNSSDIRDKALSDIDYDVVAIEEVQFLDSGVVDVIKELVYENNKIVIVAGLDMDYTGKPFDITSQLLALAEKILKLPAVCSVCGKKATKTFKRESENKNVIEVGGIDKYEPRCSFHWMNNGNL